MEKDTTGDVVASTAASSPSASRENLVPEFAYAGKNWYTLEEVRKHNSRNDCWVIIDGKVYDVTRWIPRHPGGELLILDVAGMDVTDAVLVHHMPWVLETFMPKFQIGFVKNYAPTKTSLHFRQMAKQMQRDGWYKTDPVYYIRLCIWYCILFASALWCILCGSTLVCRVGLGGFLLGMFWQQLAFLGHDLGHMAVTHNRVLDNLIGVILGNACMGIAIGWWKATHNVHHLVTNYLEYDPDIQHLPVIAIDKKFFNGIWSYYHHRYMPFDTIARFFVARQHILFYPIMALARFNLYIQSWLILVWPLHARARGIEFPKLEMCMLAVFYAGLFSIVRALPSLPEKLLFLLWSHAAAGILHLQICISHFPMEVLDSRESKPLESLDFPTLQLATCLDVDCSPWMDWFHGGLQFQTIHHLFPMLPRHRLREATRFVESFARTHGLTYHHTSFFAANRRVIDGLRQAAHKLHPWLIQLANAEG